MVCQELPRGNFVVQWSLDYKTTPWEAESGLILQVVS